MQWRYQHRVLAISLGAFFATLFIKFSIGTVVPQITAEFGTSKSAIGLALTGMWMASAVIQYPSGVFGDRFGERGIILFSLALTSAGAFLLAIATGYVAFFGFAVVIGLGTGLYVPVASTLLTKLFDENGKALSIHIAGANMAGLFAPITAAYVTIRYGWRAAPLLCALLFLPLLWMLVRWVNATPSAQPEKSMRELFGLRRGLRILIRPSIVFSMGIGVIGAFTFQAIVSFFPTFLVEYHGFGLQSAGNLFGVLFALSALSLLLVGKVAELFDYDLALLLSLVVLLSGILLALLLPHGYALLAVVLVGAGISWGGALQARYVDHLNDSEIGTGFGLIRTATGLIGSVSSVVVGTLAESEGWPLAYGVVVFLVLVAISLLLVNRTLRVGL